MVKLDSSLLSKNYLRSGAGGQFTMAANKISVKVSFDDVFNLEVLRGRFFDVFIDIALRVNNGGFTVKPIRYDACARQPR